MKNINLKSTAFTLIELLVCISIIGILFALIMPVINSAKSQVIFASCSNNLRQMGVAFNVYSVDSNGLMPGMYFLKNNVYTNGNLPWDVPKQTLSLLNNYTKSRKLWNCPSLRERGTTNAWDYNEFYGVIGYVLNFPGSPTIKTNYCITSDYSISSNAFRYPIHSGPEDNKVIVSDIVFTRDDPNNKMVEFASVPGGYFINEKRVMHHSSHIKNVNSKPTVTYGNILFTDTHVENKKFIKMKIRNIGKLKFWW